MEFTDSPFAFDLQLEQEFQRFVEAYTAPPQMAGPSYPPIGFPLVDNVSLTMPQIIDSHSRFSETYMAPHQMAGPSTPPIGFPFNVNNAMPQFIGSPFSSNAYGSSHAPNFTLPTQATVDPYVLYPVTGPTFNMSRQGEGGGLSIALPSFGPIYDSVSPNTDFPSSFMTPQGMATSPTRVRFLNMPGQAMIGPMDGFGENVPSMDGPTFAMGPNAMPFQSPVTNAHLPTFTTPQRMTPPTQGSFLRGEADPLTFHPSSRLHEIQYTTRSRKNLQHSPTHRRLCERENIISERNNV